MALVERVERDWKTRSWNSAQFEALLAAAHFEKIRFRAPGGGPVEPEADIFVAPAKRPTG